MLGARPAKSRLATKDAVGNSLSVAPIRGNLTRWIGKYEAYWSKTLLRVKEDAETESKSKPKTKKKGRSA